MSREGEEYSRPPIRPRGPSPLLWVLALTALIVAVASWIWQYWPRDRGPGRDAAAQMRPITERGPLWPEEQAIVELFDKASPSVVHIYVTTPQGRPLGSGSGFIWDSDGRIVTNHHVIEPALFGAQVEIVFKDQTIVPGDVIGHYAAKDIAVLSPRWVSKKKVVPIPLGESSKVKVGQYTFAIGAPFGLDQTLTRGIISAKGREIAPDGNRPPIKDVLQTDAAINPGNSGGPLLDSAGRLIGMNTAIYSKSGSSAGIGFAIPSDEINRLVPRIIREGKVSRPGLGVLPMDDNEARRHVERGALIAQVFPGSPAHKAGLLGSRGRLGDVIVAINGNPIAGAKELIDRLLDYKVGDTVTLTILRRENDAWVEKTVQVTLGAVD